jgi:hypothetical protein
VLSKYNSIHSFFIGWTTITYSTCQKAKAIGSPNIRHKQRDRETSVSHGNLRTMQNKYVCTGPAQKIMGKKYHEKMAYLHPT